MKVMAALIQQTVSRVVFYSGFIAAMKRNPS